MSSFLIVRSSLGFSIFQLIEPSPCHPLFLRPHQLYVFLSVKYFLFNSAFILFTFITCYHTRIRKKVVPPFLSSRYLTLQNFMTPFRPSLKVQRLTFHISTHRRKQQPYFSVYFSEIIVICILFWPQLELITIIMNTINVQIKLFSLGKTSNASMYFMNNVRKFSCNSWEEPRVVNTSYAFVQLK